MLLGERVKLLRKRAGLTQKQLAAKIGSAQQIIQRIETGQVQNTLLLKELADFFNVDIIWVQHGKGENPFLKRKLSPGYIPIISWEDIFEWVSSEKYEQVDILDSITSPNLHKAEKRYYALRIEDMSMVDDAKVFKPGNILIIDPTPSTKEIKSGDYIIYGVPGIRAATLRKMIVKDAKGFLEPLNFNYETKLFPSNFLLFGVVVEVRTQIRKT